MTSQATSQRLNALIESLLVLLKKDRPCPGTFKEIMQWFHCNSTNNEECIIKSIIKVLTKYNKGIHKKQIHFVMHSKILNINRIEQELKEILKSEEKKIQQRASRYCVQYIFVKTKLQTAEIKENELYHNITNEDSYTEQDKTDRTRCILVISSKAYAKFGILIIFDPNRTKYETGSEAWSM